MGNLRLPATPPLLSEYRSQQSVELLIVKLLHRAGQIRRQNIP